MNTLLAFVLLASSPNGSVTKRIDEAFGAFRSNGDLDQLKGRLAELANKETNSPWPWLELGNIALQERAWLDAEAAFLKVLERSPPSATQKTVRAELPLIQKAAASKDEKVQGALVYDLLIRRARESLQGGGVRAAFVHATSAAELVPNRFEAFGVLGLGLNEMRAFPEAERALLRAMELAEDPQDRNALQLAILKARRGMRGERLGREAAHLHIRGENVAAAWKFADAFDADPTQRREGISAAVGLAMSGETSTATDVLNRVSVGADPWTLKMVADVRKRNPALMGQVDLKAEADWTDGLIALDRANSPRAQAAFARAKARAPGVQRYVVSLAESHVQQGQLEVAEGLLGGVSDPNSRTMGATAALLLRREKFSDAVPILEAALGREPGSARLWRLQGSCLLGLGDAASALTALTRSVGLEPNDPLTHGAIAEAQLKLGQNDAALLAARRAIALEPLSPEFRITLASVLFKTGQTAAAKETSAQAARLSGTNALLVERLAGAP